MAPCLKTDLLTAKPVPSKGRCDVTGDVDTSSDWSSIHLVDIPTSLCHADPTSNRGKFLQLCRILSLILIPLVCLTALAGYWLVDAIFEKKELDDVREQLVFGRSLGDMVFTLQLERAQVVYAIEESNFTAMEETFMYTDSKMWSGHLDSGLCHNATGSLHDVIRQHRLTINTTYNLSTHNEVEFYSNVTSCMLGLLLDLAHDMVHGSLWHDYVSYKLLLKAQESVGVTLSLGIAFFETGSLSTADFNLLRQQDAVSQEHIQTAMLFSQKTASLVSQMETDRPDVLLAMEQYRLDWKVNSYSDHGHGKGKEFHSRVLTYFKSIAQIKTDIGNRILDKIDKEIEVAVSFMIFSVFLGVFVFILAPALIRLMYSLTTSIQNHAIMASHKSQQLIVEKQRSDSLLYQMLPKPVAQQLRMNQEVAGEYYEQVTLYFSDVVGFTEISAKSSPLEVVELLNKLYGVCDSLLDLYDVYKVETIGDAYMVVSGLPQRNGCQHVVEICVMSLELLVAVQDCGIPHLPGTPLELRVGLHTGSVVAGVVGNKMPRYCLFGDTVNTASRMESNGLPNKIHISSVTNDLLTEVKGFKTERRGLIDVKGKGPMETFWLTNTSRRLRSNQGRSLPNTDTDTPYSPNGHHIEPRGLSTTPSLI